MEVLRKWGECCNFKYGSQGRHNRKKYLKKVREFPMQITRRALQAEGTSAEALRWTQEAHTHSKGQQGGKCVNGGVGNNIRLGGEMQSM